MGAKVKLCLIGTGRAGMIHAENFCTHVKDAEMIAVSDVDAEKSQAAARELGIANWYTDYREAIQESGAEAVIIATPTKFHCDIAVCAAENGLHIFCEKPMAMSVLECEKMINAANKNKVVLQIGFMRRFCEDFARAKEIAYSGEIGEVVMIKSLTRGPSTPHEWMYDIQKSNGPLAEVNSHDLDTLRWFSESEPESVYALGGNYRCEAARNRYPDFYDTVILNIRMKNGVIGCIEGAQGVGYGYDARVEILGTKGMVTVGDLQKNSVVSYSKDKGMKSDVVESWRGLFEKAYEKEDRAFIQCILRHEKPLAGGEDGLKAVAMVNAGNESITTGRIITM